MKKVAKNNYKGLTYTITMTESGWLYEVTELGTITKRPHIIMYGGRHGEEYTKDEMEKMIDKYLKDAGVEPKSTCSYYQESYAKGGCFFSESGCCGENCSLNIEDTSSLLEELEEAKEIIREFSDPMA